MVLPNFPGNRSHTSSILFLPTFEWRWATPLTTCSKPQSGEKTKAPCWLAARLTVLQHRQIQTQIPQLDEVSGWVNYTWWMFQQATGIPEAFFLQQHVRRKSESRNQALQLKGFPKKKGCPTAISIKKSKLAHQLIFLGLL